MTQRKKKKLNQKWQLDPAEVRVSGGGSSECDARRIRQSRATRVTSASYRFWHIPSGVAVEGSIPLGYYSKSEMRKLKEDLCAQLFMKLEKKVAQALRISGWATLL